MIRDYKFRGKRVDNGVWVKGNLLVNSFGTFIQVEYLAHDEIGNSEPALVEYEVIPKTVGQYIERKDKNGKEIFEGDRISHMSGHGEYVGTVEFRRDYHTSGFKINWDGLSCSVSMERCEIIENIHKDTWS